MSDIGVSGRDRRPCRQFSDEFKAQTVRSVLDEGKSVNTVAVGGTGPVFRTRCVYARWSRACAYSAEETARNFARLD